MSSESGKTIVTALIRPHMKEHVVRALHDLPEFPGFFFLDARGQGRGRGTGGSYAASESDFTYHHFLQLQIACRPDQVGAICDLIAVVAWTGRKGDGVIFTTDATSFVRIREGPVPRSGVRLRPSPSAGLFPRPCSRFSSCRRFTCCSGMRSGMALSTFLSPQPKEEHSEVPTLGRSRALVWHAVALTITRD